MKDPHQPLGGMACPLPASAGECITLAHGGGGAATGALIRQQLLPLFDNPVLAPLGDGALLPAQAGPLAYTTDSYVVRPAVFPGGDIGALAITGTCNDLAMCGARPLWLSLSLILEEGLELALLQRLLASAAQTARAAGVRVVTGDTKVVERGSGDGIYINTSSIGTLVADPPPAPGRIAPGDAVIVSGDIARHGMAVMAAREGLALENPIASDMADLWPPVQALLKAGIELHCLRDATRGGVATALIEIARDAGLAIQLDEARLPVTEPVRGLCELMGFDPLYVANEGCMVLFVPAHQAQRALEVLQTHPPCRAASLAGQVTSPGGDTPEGTVTATTVIGTRRVLDLLSGEQLPRIC